MKNIKLKIFTASVLALLQTTVFCVDTPIYDNSAITNSLNQVSTNIVKAINTFRTETMDALHGPANYSIVNAINTAFIGSPDTAGGTQSIIDKKVDGYVQNFYTLYATDKNFINNELEIVNKTELNPSKAAVDILEIEKKVKQGVKNQLNQEIYYDTQKTPLDKIKDIFALLIMKAESGDNNINDVSIDPTFRNGNPYGSLDDSINSTDMPQSILDVSALIGPDSYSKEEGTAANNAKLFISQLIKTAPPPKTFSFPQAINGDSMTLYLPYTNTTANPSVPYTIVKIPTNTPSGGTSQYQQMLTYLNKNSLYQEYKIKVRSLLALRTLFFEGIFNIFQERYKEKKADSSMHEKEKYMAMVGLTQTYYNDLKTKSVADVNLETLHTLNKIVYFLHKLHQDNERAQLITSINGIQTPLSGIQDDVAYIRPIVTLISNGCWDTKVQAPNGLAANNDTRNTVCANPQSATSSI